MTSGPLVDYHCHLDLYPEHREAFEACRNQDIEILTVTTTPRAWMANVEMARGMPNIRVGLGLHPQLVGTKEADIVLFESLAPKAQFIGEVGLDAGPRFYKTIELQKQIFERVLKISARTGPKIISVHSVRSVGMILPMIERHLSASKSQVVLHWFTGSLAEAKKALSLGCWFSINPQMQHSESAKRFIAEIPLSRMLTESDGPFTQSSPGVASTPRDVVQAARLIAHVKKLGTEEVCKKILLNLGVLEVVLEKPN